MGAAVGCGGAPWAAPSVNHMRIAASCLAVDLGLVTYNHADFEDFERHHGLRMLPDRPGSRLPACLYSFCNR
jgi:predicted nucleic acid-binding protein